MAFPSPSIPAPAIGLYQLQFNGVTFGGIAAGTPYQLTGMKGGLDLPGITGGDVQRPLDAGEFAGWDVPGGRDIPIDLTVKADNVSLDHARQELGGAFRWQANVEAPLFIHLPSGTYATMCRPRKFNFGLDINTLLAGATPVNALLHSTDARWYASPSKAATVGLSTIVSAAAGLSWPATWPASWGAGTAANLLDVWNLGNVEMRPVLVITGPCTNPSVANTSIAGSPTLTFALTLNAGDTLTIDTDFQTATLVTAGSTQGSPRDNALVRATSTWWNLLPANGPDGIAQANIIAFTSADASTVAGTLTVQSADAYPVL